MITLNKALLIVLITALIPLASAADIKATFTGLENGQEVSDLDESGLFPGDSGKWKISFEVNESTQVFITLDKISDSENSCEEPENEPSDSCADTGELDEVLEFNGFLDSDSDLEYDADEVLFEVSENTTKMEDPDAVEGNFSSGNVYELIVNWDIKSESGNIFMTDSTTFEVLLSAGSTANETSSDPVIDQSVSSGSASSSSAGFSTTRADPSGTEDTEVEESTSAVENRGSGSEELGTLIVDVSGPDSAPVNASVTISEPADIREFTGDDGKAEFVLDQDNYSVNMASPGYEEQDSKTRVTSGDETLLNVTLVSAGETLESETAESSETALESVTGAFSESRAGSWLLSLIVIIGGSLIAYRHSIGGRKNETSEK